MNRPRSPTESSSVALPHIACMNEFAALLERLALTSDCNAKLDVLKAYFASTPDPERGLALAVITGELTFKAVKAGVFKDMALSRLDEQLFALSYEYVGNLAETVSHVWPSKKGANKPPDLSEIVDVLATSDRMATSRQLEGCMDALDKTGRWALIKLATGGLRIGLSTRLAKQALADYGDVDITEIEEIWHGLTAPYEELFAWLEGRANKPTPDDSILFRPMMLAQPLVARRNTASPDAINPEKITLQDYAFEWKWDGVRVQAASNGIERRLYSNSGDDISGAFPDLLNALEFNAVVDGILLIKTPEGGVADFNALQDRLTRKSVNGKLVSERPAFIRAFDLLRLGKMDLRALPFVERRKQLETLAASLMSDRIDLSQLVPVADHAMLDLMRNAPPTPEIEGIMLKRWDSAYVAGRPRNSWLKFRRDPFLADVVLMYAQRGQEPRSGKFSDFTFGVWCEKDGEKQLTPVGKAKLILTDKDLKKTNTFINENTEKRFGPVTSVTANEKTGLVFEIAFDGVFRSNRHKSGLTLRGPRIIRIRWDKPPGEADWIETFQARIAKQTC